MKTEAVTVVGANNSQLTIEPGEIWPLPFRGSKYTVCRVGATDQVVWSRYDQRLPAVNDPAELADSVRDLKGANGSFRITAHGAVIAKVPLSGGRDSESRYVGVYEDDLQFEGIDNNPCKLRMGMYWTGFPFHNGEAWNVSPYSQSRNHLRWRMRGHTFVSTDRYPEIVRKCLSIRPRGGRVYMTESGHIWMNVPDGGLAPWHREEFQKLQNTQLDEFLDEKRLVLVRLLVDRIEATSTRPVYVGHMRDFDHGAPPWTSFSLDGDYQFGCGDGADDELGAS